MNKTSYFSSAAYLSLFLIFSQSLFAEASIELSISSEKLVANESVQQSNKQGSNKTAMKATTNPDKVKSPDTQEALPGEQLLYTIHYVNLGKHAALEAAINTTIDQATIYKAGSASCKNCNIVYSSNGDYFDSSDKLESKPESYTHIRWIFDEIAAGEEGQVSYSVVVK